MAFTLSILPQTLEDIHDLIIISFEVGDIWFSNRVFYIPIPVTIRVEPNLYELS